MKSFPRLAVIFLMSAVLLGLGCSTEVKIGAVLSESGAVAPYSQQVERGLDLALEEINAAGGFKGGPIQLVYRDDGSSGEKGRAAVSELIEQEGVKIVIGAVSSSVTLEIAPICEKKGVVLLSPTSSAPRISEAGEYIFRNYPSDILEGTAMADFARKQGVRRVVIVALDNEFGAGLSEVFTRRFESKSRKVARTFRLQEGDTASYSTIIEEIKELEPQAIYIVAYVDVMSDLLKQFAASGLEALMMGSGSVTEQLARTAGDAARNFVYPQPVFDPESDDAAVTEFVQAFRAKYNMDPDIYAAHGYDALKLIVQAMTNTGFAFPDEVKRGLHNLKDYSGAAGPTQFDERGDVVRYPRVFVIHEGTSMPFEQYEQEIGELPIPHTG